MKAFKVITNPEAFQLLADETRRRIVYLLRAKEMTVSQIAAELNLTPQAIYHHIRKMRDAELVEVAREERVDHFIETYYRATAEIFNMAWGKGTSQSQAYFEQKTAEGLRALSKIGLPVRSDSDIVSRLVGLVSRLEQIEKGEFSDAIANLEDVDFLTKQGVSHFAKLLTMSDAEFNEYLKLVREERDLLRSIREKTSKAAVIAQSP